MTRDRDLLVELAHFDASLVVISLTSLDARLASLLEPRASRPQARLEAIRSLSEAGIPVCVSVAPIIPGLNEHEIPSLLEAAADHGAQFASGTLLRLPYSVKDIFSDWLERHFPDRKRLVLHRVRETRDSHLSDSDFHSRMKGKGPLAEQIHQLVAVSKKRNRLSDTRAKLSTSSFSRQIRGQLELF